MHAEHPDLAIITNQVSRSFGGVAALRDFTLRVPRGSVYGLLGRNGSGKTTAIKILAGLLRPDTGSVAVLGGNPFEFTAEDRQRIGYLSEKQVLPPIMRVGKLLDFCAPLYPNWDHALANKLLAQFGIEPKKKVSELSQGTQRQVAFLLALAQRPELLILDEPASTLDVVARREFLEEILELLRENEATVLISSHILSDIERVADQIGIIADGQLKISEPLDELKETVKQIRFHSFSQGIDSFAWEGAFRTVRSKGELLVTARVREEAQLAQTARALGAQYELLDLGLEDIFVELSRN